MNENNCEYASLIPRSDPYYIKFGCYDDLMEIIKSRYFYPVFITGLSGNGKTTTVEQICSLMSREIIRVNLTKQTDEDDLLGGFRLSDGETKWFDGPVVRALEKGAILLLDEVDLGTENIMCLQSVLEGKGVYLKKINRYVHAAEGFNIIATANTKGQGNDSGKFVGTQFMNEAFLDRFPITLEQDYPKKEVESEILHRFFELKENLTDDTKDFTSKLVEFAEKNRIAFDKNPDETAVISTRRLICIANAFCIYKNKRKALLLSVSRFDASIRDSLMAFYEAIDPSIRSEDYVPPVKEEEDPWNLKTIFGDKY